MVSLTEGSAGAAVSVSRATGGKHGKTRSNAMKQGCDA